MYVVLLFLHPKLILYNHIIYKLNLSNFIIHYTSSSRCVQFVLKIFVLNYMNNEVIVYLKWTELNQICSWKRAFHFNKIAPLTKWILDNPEG